MKIHTNILFGLMIGLLTFWIQPAYGQPVSKQTGIKGINTHGSFTVQFIHETEDGHYRVIATTRKSNYDSLQVHFLTLNASMELIDSISIMPERRWGGLSEVKLLQDGYLMGFQIGTSSSNWRGVNAYIYFDGTVKWSRVYDFNRVVTDSEIAGDFFYGVQFPPGTYSSTFYINKESLIDSTHSAVSFKLNEGDARVNSTLLTAGGSMYIAFDGRSFGLIVKVKNGKDLVWAKRIDLENGNRFSPVLLREIESGNIQFVYNNNTGSNAGDKPSIVELDTAGNLRWAKRYSTLEERLTGAALDRIGNNTYLAAYRLASGNADRAFLFRLDHAGNLLETSVSNIKRSNFSYGGFTRFYPLSGGLIAAVGPGLNPETLIQIVPKPEDVCRYEPYAESSVEDVTPALTSLVLDFEPYSYRITDSVAFTKITGNVFGLEEKCITALSVEGLEAAGFPEIYPNPAQEYIRFSSLEAPALLRIFDMRGVEAINRWIQPDESVGIADLNSGIYIWQVESSGRVYRGKLVAE